MVMNQHCIRAAVKMIMNKNYHIEISDCEIDTSLSISENISILLEKKKKTCPLLIDVL